MKLRRWRRDDDRLCDLGDRSFAPRSQTLQSRRFASFELTSVFGVDIRRLLKKLRNRGDALHCVPENENGVSILRSYQH